MRIANLHSHLNGYEWVLVHKPGVWTQLEWAVKSSSARDFTLSYRRKLKRFKQVNESKDYFILTEFTDREGMFRLGLNLRPLTRAEHAISAHFARYKLDQIDIGVSLLRLSPGRLGFEETRSFLLRNRTTLAVPLILLGVESLGSLPCGGCSFLQR